MHGFYSLLKTALKEKGFFDDTEPHKLIVCGDVLDRGEEAVEMQNFMIDLLNKGELILVRGNHEDLMVDMIENFWKYEDDISTGWSHHISNGTLDSALQLSGMYLRDVLDNPDVFVRSVKNSPFYKTLIPASIDYFETNNYIFVHGWIPCITDDMPNWYRKNRHYNYNPDWRNANKKDWDAARWFNGMELAGLYNVVEINKQIICGHWHCSFGHYYFGVAESEFGDHADFSPFYHDGIIAIDACTAHSGKVNCIVIED